MALTMDLVPRTKKQKQLLVVVAVLAVLAALMWTGVIDLFPAEELPPPADPATGGTAGTGVAPAPVQ